MSATEQYKRNVIIKAIVVPLVVTLIAVVAFFAVKPAIQHLMPNADAYEQTVEAEEGEVVAYE